MNVENNLLKNNCFKSNSTDLIIYTNDNLVNDFLNQNISLESLIEKEIYNIK